MKKIFIVTALFLFFCCGRFHHPHDGSQGPAGEPGKDGQNGVSPTPEIVVVPPVVVPVVMGLVTKTTECSYSEKSANIVFKVYTVGKNKSSVLHGIYLGQDGRTYHETFSAWSDKIVAPYFSAKLVDDKSAEIVFKKIPHTVECK
jgi:hypothetical protein